MDFPFPSPADLKDIQGDVILGFRKRYEFFRFFTISNIYGFKRGLKNLTPFITTTEDIQHLNSRIKEHKMTFEDGSLIKTSGINISFTYTGMSKLGISESIGDADFEAGQLAHAQALGDPGTTDSSGNYTPNWIPAFKGEIDGVILIAGDSERTVTEEIVNVALFMGQSVEWVHDVMGNVRTGDNKGHEHFGFLDGISQPAVENLTVIYPGQQIVRPGVLLLRQRGDDKALSRPIWTRNGSILVYRHLAQLVPEFNKFLNDNPLPEAPSRKEGSELLGARFFGRWKSGAPTQLAPTEDNPKLGADPQRNNNFDFSETASDDQTGCPFAAHIRKTNPRTDLTSRPDLPPDFVEKRCIMRAGIPFGPDAPELGENSGKTVRDHIGEIPRGLAFVCYQSILENGFEFMQKRWSNNTQFPEKFDHATGERIIPGFDPIIGQNGNDIRTTAGSDPNNQRATLTLPIDFVVPRGGAYFFTPSLTALNTVFVA